MGYGDACPVYAGKRYLDWELTNPPAKSVDEVRPIIDHIDERARGLLTELLGEAVARQQPALRLRVRMRSPLSRICHCDSRRRAPTSAYWSRRTSGENR
jgi:hypothetical protein